jgi:hypothetical protein
MTTLINFNPKKPLFAQLGFWVALLLPIGISLVLIISLAIVENLSWEWTSPGFANFLTIFALPIGVAGLSIPLVAVCASQHRSVQSAAQIEAANSQNLLTNYYKHLEEFKKYLEDEASKDLSMKISNRKLHRAVYTDIKIGIDRPSEDFLNELASSQKHLDDLIEELFSDSPPSFDMLFVGDNWTDTILALTYFFDSYGMKVIFRDQKDRERYDLMPAFQLSMTLERSLLELRQLFSHCFEFSQVSIKDHTDVIFFMPGRRTFAALEQYHKEVSAVEITMSEFALKTDEKGNLYPQHGLGRFKDKADMNDKIAELKSKIPPLGNPIHTLLLNNKKIDNRVIKALLDDSPVFTEAQL